MSRRAVATVQSEFASVRAAESPLIALRAFSAPIALVLWLASVIANAALPTQPIWAIVGLTALLLTSAQKWVVGAFLAAALLTTYGAAGEVAYLGVGSISGATTANAANFFLFGGVGSWAIGRKTFVSGGFRPLGRAWTILAAVAITLLLARFTLGGIPILRGDSGRLEGVASIPALLGLATGALPIALAYVRTERSVLRSWLKITLVVLVFATASRLLVAAVLLGLLSQSDWINRRLSLRQVFAVLGTGTIVVVAVLRVYSLRTDATIAETFGGRVAGLNGLPGFVTDMIGPSLFFGARNGLVVYETMSAASIHPPGGFIMGGILNVLSLGADPERWLTQALGFDVLMVGAIATPIWSGATVDFGPVGAAALAVIIGGVCTWWAQRMPFARPWVTFAIVLSAYGSYLVSAQFVAASVAMIMMAILAKTTVPRNE